MVLFALDEKFFNQKNTLSDFLAFF